MIITLELLLMMFPLKGVLYLDLKSPVLLKANLSSAQTRFSYSSLANNNLVKKSIGKKQEWTSYFK